MSLTLILAVTVIQFVIQFALYCTVRKPTMSLIGTMYKAYMGFLANPLMIGLNLGISLIVLSFTAAGAIAGITNLFASALLGIFMYKDVLKTKQECSKRFNFRFWKRNK